MERAPLPDDRLCCARGAGKYWGSLRSPQYSTGRVRAFLFSAMAEIALIRRGVWLAGGRSWAPESACQPDGRNLALSQQVIARTPADAEIYAALLGRQKSRGGVKRRTVCVGPTPPDRDA
jgi:hypothetical protein